ncbi:methyl-accepting chemotaxis protein [Bifidobacterium pullorum]|uniref:methyl-accepting chemotaxis protein n=1 Tax=Bifidobacterium pullorum TaxID=78448 RepID=UPI00197AF392|nr:methyl-accepting chemotaxis protein [Bifidobacterium pullorum]
MSGNLYIYGKVGADVMPDTRGFRRELQAKLAAAMRGYEYELPISVDIDAMSYRAFKKKIENDELEQTVKLAYDASQVKKAMRDLGGKDLDELKIPLDADTRQFERETRRTANQLEDSIEDALSRGFKLGTGNAQRALNDLKRRIEADKFEMTIDAQVDLDEAQRQLDRLGRDLKIADRFDRQADQLERRAKLMAARFPDFEIDVDIDKAVADLRRLSQQVKDGEDLSVTVRGKAELNLCEANRELDRFKDNHDKLDMDVDVSTKLASAHLKYFTRPRTVDIYAKFKGTDLGKIINGITYGATGLEGVTNQFQKLVKLFDSLDDVVPKFSLIGAAAISLSAGLLNLGRSAGGVGVSLVSMSKAALAAPAALTGLAAAGYSAYAAYQVASKQFDVTATSLAGMTDAVGTAAWDEFGDELYRIANEIAPTLRDGLTGIATEEGKVAAGLLRVVEQSDKAGEPANIFSRTQQMVAELNPGLQDLVKSFLDLGDETSEYLPRMGAYISDAADSMAHWVEQARQSGAITDAMEAAIEQGDYLKDSFKSLTGILGGTFGTLAQTENGIEGISKALAKADRAVNSVKFQETLEAWSRGAQTAQNNMRDSLDDIGDALYSLRDEAEQVFGDAGAIVGSGIEGISRVLEQSGDGIKDFSSGIRDGFEYVFDAVGDAGPMFDELLSMVGQLSRTFGGTFASGLRTAAPLISAIATAAETTAKAFDALPDSVKGAITLYMTFGRAGKQAMDSIKTGMLTNIIQTAQYQKALSGLGLSASSLDTSFQGVLKSWLQMRGVDVSAFSSLGDSANGASGKVSGLSAALGGLGGVLKSAAIGGAIGLVTVAVSDFIQKGQETEQVANDIGTALADMSGMAESAVDGIDSVGRLMREAFGRGDYAEGGWNWLSDLRTGFDSAAEAAERTKISITDMSDAIEGGSSSYSELRSKLVEVRDAHTQMVTGMAGGVQVQDSMAKAAQKQIESLDQMNSDYRDQVHTLALANGHTADYADSLIDAGEDAAALSIILGDTQTQTEMLAEAQRIAADAAEDQRLAQRDLISAQSDYGQVLEDSKSQIDEINALVEQTGAVWDANAKSIEGMSGSFNTASEAGRQAQQVLQELGDSGHDLLESMVDAGATSDEVTAKQAELAQSFYDTATAMGVPEDAARRLQEVYGLTPAEVETLFKAKVEESKATLTQYLANIRAMFPEEGNTAVFTTVLEAINSGAVTGIAEVQGLFEKLMNGNVSTRAVTLLLNADGDALWKTANVQSNLEALGMTPETYTWLLNGEGTAEERMAKIREELSWLQLSDEQIQWILDCIDNASDKMDKTEEKKQHLNKPASFIIDADDAPAQTVMAGIRSYDGMVIARPWAYVMGDNNDARTKFGEVSVYDGMTIAQPWGRVRGENNEARARFAEVVAYDGRTISQPWGRVMGNADNVWSVFQSIQKTNDTVLATRYVDIITRSNGKVQAATGGHISGPGTGTSDSIPAMLSNGEFVLRAASVRKLESKYGSGILDYLNRMGEIPNRRVSSTVERYRRDSYAYASGGRVRAVDIGSSSVDNSRVVNVTIDARRVQSDPTLRRLLGSLADHVTRYSNM